MSVAAAAGRDDRQHADMQMLSGYGVVATRDPAYVTSTAKRGLLACPQAALNYRFGCRSAM
jgi:hypothetical protein